MSRTSEVGQYIFFFFFASTCPGNHADRWDFNLHTHYCNHLMRMGCWVGKKRTDRRSGRSCYRVRYLPAYPLITLLPSMLIFTPDEVRLSEISICAGLLVKRGPTEKTALRKSLEHGSHYAFITNRLSRLFM